MNSTWVAALPLQQRIIHGGPDELGLHTTHGVLQ
jgi:hypothetical protein